MHDWTFWEARGSFEPSFCPSGRNQVRPPKGVSAAEPPLWRQHSAAEVAPEKRLSSLSGTFGRRRCRRKCPVQPFHAYLYVIFSGCFRGFLGSILELYLRMFGPSFESTRVGSDPRNRGPQQGVQLLRCCQSQPEAYRYRI
ncbi:hypothetical protein MANES_05G086326v8 [Manihot esculenta]|uniref:Uncharacterized protein n=1 Tax=Manihot esculenta TaxID=3983 RepID=A0ACB7HP80_MANES|nr:hypothetical protein MANES_05G086326v8 [Manihot esculenta]